MSKIQQPIPTQLFQIATTDILNILLVEFANQEDEDFKNTKFFLERITPVDKTETPAVVVRFAGSRNRVSGRIEQNMIATYHIDVYANSVNTSQQDSDIRSTTLVQKISGAIRWILMYPQYFRLDFAQPRIESTVVTDLLMGEPRDNRDAETTMWARVVFDVYLQEGSEPVSPGILNDYQTIVRLFNTDKGYEWLTEKTPE